MYVFHEIDEKDLIISPYAPPPPHHPQPLLGKEGSILAVPVVRTPLLTKLLYAHNFWRSYFSRSYALRGNEKKPVGVEAFAGGPAATTFNGAPTPTG